MSKPRHAAPRTTWRWRQAGSARLVGVIVVMALIALTINFTLSSKGNSDSTTTLPATSTTTPATTTTTMPTALNKIVPPGPPASSRRLVLYKDITGDISPKSVMSTNTGLVFAQNMMYRHTMTVYNSAGTLLKTISDGVVLSRFGVHGRPGLTHGAPVEAAVTPDGKDVWVSNYSMYGTGSGPEGSDTCTPASSIAAGDTPSFLYEVSTKTLSVVGVAEVGMVPKFVAVTPNDKYVIASNWCSWTVSVVNEATHRVVATIPVGAYPRGIAISPDSHLAYVAIMGSTVIDVISLSTFKIVGQIGGVDNVRHVVIDPQNPDILYASLNQPGDVVKIDRLTGKILAEVHTGSDCRSLAISTDGTALYVVNYLSNTVTELASSNLKILQVVPTGTNPVGVTYDGTTGRVWVAVYTGAILVFNTKPS
ncbi:MAG: cytochrome D1 domain-containing protein [Acidimicrobiales bacterium]